MPNFASFRVIARLLGVVYGAVQGSSKISPFFLPEIPIFSKTVLLPPENSTQRSCKYFKVPKSVPHMGPSLVG